MSTTDDSATPTPIPPLGSGARRPTRKEASAANKAAWKQRHAAPMAAPTPAPGDLAPPPEWAHDAPEVSHLPVPAPRVGPDGAALPPETHAELEARALVIYRRLLDRLEGIAENPRSTHNDIIGAAGHLRLASSIGRSDPAPVRFVLPMASLLGSDGPSQGAPGAED